MLSGGINLDQAMAKIKEGLSVDVSIGNPWENVAKKKKTSEDGLGNFNVALGLAMRKL